LDEFEEKEGPDMMVHVRQDGRSLDLHAAQVNITAQMSDAEIRRALARHLDVALDAFEDLVVDRRPGGDIVVRPEAVYG
jgi:hypothetical protein